MRSRSRSRSRGEVEEKENERGKRRMGYHAIAFIWIAEFTVCHQFVIAACFVDWDITR